MQQTNGGPRMGFTDAEVREALLWEHGGKYSWGIDVLDQDFIPIGAGYIYVNRFNLGSGTTVRGFTMSPEGVLFLPWESFRPTTFSQLRVVPEGAIEVLASQQVTTTSGEQGLRTTEVAIHQEVSFQDNDMYLVLAERNRKGTDTWTDARGNTWLGNDAAGTGWFPAINNAMGANGQIYNYWFEFTQPTVDPSYAIRAEFFRDAFVVTPGFLIDTPIGSLWWDNTPAGITGTIAGQALTITDAALVSGGFAAHSWGQIEVKWDAATDTISMSYRAQGTDLTLDTGWTLLASATPGAFSVGNGLQAPCALLHSRVPPPSGPLDYSSFALSAVCCRRVGVGTDVLWNVKESDFDDYLFEFTMDTGQVVTATNIIATNLYGSMPIAPRSTNQAGPIMTFDHARNGAQIWTNNQFIQTVVADNAVTEFAPNLSRIFMRIFKEAWGSLVEYVSEEKAADRITCAIQHDVGDLINIIFYDDTTPIATINTPSFAPSANSGAIIAVQFDSRPPGVSRVQVKTSFNKFLIPDWDDPAWTLLHSANMPTGAPVPFQMNDIPVIWGDSTLVAQINRTSALFNPGPFLSSYRIEVGERVNIELPSIMPNMLWNLTRGAPDMGLHKILLEAAQPATVISAQFLDFETVQPEDLTVEDVQFLELQIGEPLEFSACTVDWSYRPASVGENSTDYSQVRRTGSLEAVGFPPPWFNPFVSYVRPYIIVPYNGQDIRFDLGTFTLPLAPRTDDGVMVSSSYDLVDFSYRIASTKCLEPVQINETTAVVTQVKAHLTAEFGITTWTDPPATYLSKLLLDPLTFDADTAWSEILNTALEAIGLDAIIFDEYGALVFQERTDLTREIEWSYIIGSNVVEGGSIAPLLPDIPNEIEFVAERGAVTPSEGDGMRTLTNQDIGPASIDARGYTVRQRVVVEAQTQEDLDVFAYETSEYMFAGGGDRLQTRVLLNPLHSDRDFVVLDKPRFGITGGQWNVVSWRITLDDEPSGVMELTLERRQKAGVSQVLPATNLKVVWDRAGSGGGGFQLTFTAGVLLAPDIASATSSRIYYRTASEGTFTNYVNLPWGSGVNQVYLPNRGYDQVHYFRVDTDPPDTLTVESSVLQSYSARQPGTTSVLRPSRIYDCVIPGDWDQLTAESSPLDLLKVAPAAQSSVLLFVFDDLPTHTHSITPTAVRLRLRRNGSLGTTQPVEVWGIYIAGVYFPTPPSAAAVMGPPRGGRSPSFTPSDVTLEFVPTNADGTSVPLTAWANQLGLATIGGLALTIPSGETTGPGAIVSLKNGSALGATELELDW